jgi:hypothetical protein
MGQVQPALAGHEELAPDGGLAIIESDLQSGSSGDFRRSQASGTATDDRELGMAVQGGGGKRSPKECRAGMTRRGVPEEKVG